MEQKRIKTQFNPAKGFSLLEILVALATGSLITAAACIFFYTQSKAVSMEMKKSDIQSNLRAAVTILEQELKRAGFNPRQIRGRAAPAIYKALPGRIAFQADINENGAGFNGSPGLNGITYSSDSDPGEKIVLGLKKESSKSGDIDGDGIADGFPCRLWKETEKQHLVIAENIEVLRFKYLDSNGSLLSHPEKSRNKISQVEITIVARASTPTKGYRNNRTYFDTDGKTIFQAPGDAYLRGSLTKRIYCRNLEL